MSEELKACPFCGSEADKAVTYLGLSARCKNDDCDANGLWFHIEQWNTREQDRLLGVAKEALEDCRSTMNICASDGNSDVRQENKMVDNALRQIEGSKG